MNETTLLAILTPILLTFGGIISWLIKAKREESLNAETKSREFKIDTYKKLLEPFIATWTFTLPKEQKEKEINKITTLEYRKTVFDLTTFGSDEVLKIFNKIMQTFFHADNYKKQDCEYSEEYGIRLLALVSELLLQIRKDIYSKKTKLKRTATIEFMITDMDQNREKINKYHC